MVAPFQQGLGFSQGLPFRVQIDREIFVGGVHADMTKPMGDGAQIDSRAQQMYSSAVSEGMRVQALVFQRNVSLRRLGDVLFED